MDVGSTSIVQFSPPVPALLWFAPDCRGYFMSARALPTLFLPALLFCSVEALQTTPASSSDIPSLTRQ